MMEDILDMLSEGHYILHAVRPITSLCVIKKVWVVCNLQQHNFSASLDIALVGVITVQGRGVKLRSYSIKHSLRGVVYLRGLKYSQNMSSPAAFFVMPRMLFQLGQWEVTITYVSNLFQALGWCWFDKWLLYILLEMFVNDIILSLQCTNETLVMLVPKPVKPNR